MNLKCITLIGAEDQINW